MRISYAAFCFFSSNKKQTNKYNCWVEVHIHLHFRSGVGKLQPEQATSDLGCHIKWKQGQFCISIKLLFKFPPYKFSWYQNVMCTLIKNYYIDTIHLQHLKCITHTRNHFANPSFKLISFIVHHLLPNCFLHMPFSETDLGAVTTKTP